MRGVVVQAQKARQEPWPMHKRVVSEEVSTATIATAETLPKGTRLCNETTHTTYAVAHQTYRRSKAWSFHWTLVRIDDIADKRHQIQQCTSEQTEIEILKPQSLSSERWLRIMPS